MDMELDAIRQRHDRAIEYANRGSRMSQAELDVDNLLDRLGTLNRRFDRMAKLETECARLRAAAQAVVETWNDLVSDPYQHDRFVQNMDVLAAELEGSIEDQ